MKVVVDAEKCQGHNRCHALAPELFDVDDYGESVVIGSGDVPPVLEDKARLAVANCPEFAVSIEGEGVSASERPARRGLRGPVSSSEALVGTQ